MNWYVVYTKPKWERKVAERLNQIGIGMLLPVDYTSETMV